MCSLRIFFFSVLYFKKILQIKEKEISCSSVTLRAWREVDIKNFGSFTVFQGWQTGLRAKPFTKRGSSSWYTWWWTELKIPAPDTVRVWIPLEKRSWCSPAASRWCSCSLWTHRLWTRVWRRSELTFSNLRWSSVQRCWISQTGCSPGCPGPPEWQWPDFWLHEGL